MSSSGSAKGARLYSMLVAIVLQLLCMSVPDKAVAASEPGSVVRSRAEISWFDSAKNRVTQTQSNATMLTVASVYRFSLGEQLDTTAHAGKFISLSRRLYNTGNTVDRYRVAVDNLPGDSGDLQGLRIFHDVNGNGIADAGEPLLTETPLLNQGQMIELVIAGNIPGNLLEGDRFLVELRADSLSGRIPLQASINTITGVDGAFLSLNMSSTTGCRVELQPGDSIDYRIDFNNSGNRIPVSRVHDIEGVLREGVLIVDQLPIETILSVNPEISYAPLQAIPIVRGVGERWTHSDNWDTAEQAREMGLYLPAESLQPGQSGRFAFSLQTQDYDTAGKVVENRAAIDLDGDGRAEFESNTVCNQIASEPVPLGAVSSATLRFVEPATNLRVSGAAPTLEVDEDFVESGSFQVDDGLGSYIPVRDGLYLELTAADLESTEFVNASGKGAYIVVTLRSIGTADTLMVVMVETGPDTGVYRNIRPITLSSELSGGARYCPGGSEPPMSPIVDYEMDAPSCVLRSFANDTLEAFFDDSQLGIALKDTVVIDPQAIVFDAYNFAPVADATVTLYRLSGADASESDAIAVDRLTGEPLVMITDVNGRYSVPQLEPGSRYYIRVEAPSQYLFPSDVPSEQITRYDVNQYSYGPTGNATGGTGVFAALSGEATPLHDIPLDPADRALRLVVEKSAMQTEAEPGDVVAYSLRVSNQSEDVQYDVLVYDRLPFGFKLVPDTVDLDDTIFAEDVGGPGPELVFSLGTLEPGQEHELTYVLEATAGAIDGDGINIAAATARTSSGVLLQSAESRARVKLRRTGVLSDQASLFGKVYIDSDCNNLQNSGEWPIGGIKLYLEDGTYVITDENGQYSLYGLSPGLHVLRIDLLTAPLGLTFKPLDNANAANGDSRFVDLSSGDFHRADFAASCPLEKLDEVFEQIRARNQKIDGDWSLDEAEQFDPNSHEGESDSVHEADMDGDLSNGILNGPDAGRTRSERNLEDEIETDIAGLDPQQSSMEKSADVMIDPKIAARSITLQQAKTGTWLWPQGDISHDGRFVAVLRAGVVPMLFVNGKPVDNSQIGERIENYDARAQIVAWYGVTLRAGLNRVEVRGQDGFGNIRILARKKFKRPMMGTRMVLRARDDTLPADGGRTVLPIDINILDDNDYPARGIHFVTLMAEGVREGTWLEQDIQDNEPGHQVRVENGRGTVHLRSSEFTGTVIVQAHTSDMNAEMRVYQVAALRPLFANGLVQLGVRSGSVRKGDFAPSDQADEHDEGTTVEGQVSVFLKGRVKGDAQLTLAYDSKKDKDSELLRDINPNAHYPIHGDASVRGYEAQSRSRLYAKLEQGKNSVMWGDYLTDSDTDVDDLARVQRVLTGFNSHYDDGRTRLQLFAARPEEARNSELLRGNGTSMLYRLEGAPVVTNSEVVEVIVRDRDNAGLVISAQRLTRFRDYALDSISGNLTFANPVPSFDEDLNPIHIRVSYDQENGGHAHTVAGVRIQHALTDALITGLSYTDDDSPEEGHDLRGAFLKYRPNENVGVTVGVARMVHDDSGASGDAQRLTIERNWGSEARKRRTSVRWARADEEFENSGSGIAAGRQELRLEHRERITQTLRASIEGVHSESLSSEELRSTLGITLDKSFDEWTFKGGTRHIRQQASSTSDNFNTAIVGAERRIRIGNKAGSASAEYEQDIDQGNRNRISLSGKMQVHDHAHLFGRYERQNGIEDGTIYEGLRSTESLAIGAESDILPKTRLYSEYRMRGGIDSRDLETGSGVRGNYELKPGLSVTPALEVVDTLSGDDSGDGVAISLGAADVRNPNAKTSGRVEYRKGEESDYVGLRYTHAARLDLDWTALMRENLTYQNKRLGQSEMRHEFTVGLARRPRLDNRHHLLFQYTWKVERIDANAGDRAVHVLSTHQNLQINPRLVISARLGGKRQDTFLERNDYTTSAYLLDGRASWDIDRRWNLDIRAGLLTTGGRQSRRFSMGAGVSYLLDRNLQLQLGYNVAGFRDEDLDPEEYDAEGIRFGLRYKFDDKAFNWLQD